VQESPALSNPGGVTGGVHLLMKPTQGVLVRHTACPTKSIGYIWSSLAGKIGHLIPVWRPYSQATHLFEVHLAIDYDADGRHAIVVGVVVVRVAGLAMLMIMAVSMPMAMPMLMVVVAIMVVVFPCRVRMTALAAHLLGMVVVVAVRLLLPQQRGVDLGQ
jgi:hypothetical protein